MSGADRRGTDRRGFDWEEIVEALHLTGVTTHTSFWREVQRLRSKSVDRRPPAKAPKEESGSDGAKPNRLPGKRGQELLSNSNVLVSLRRQSDKRRKKVKR